MAQYYGPAMITTRMSGMGLDEMYRDFQSGRLNMVKVQLPPGFGTHPSDVKGFIEHGAKMVILRTDDGLAGYSYENIRDWFEQPRDDNMSYAQLVQNNPDVEWWIEIGNEPDLGGLDPYVARWWALAAYKELALNFVGHIDQPWKEKYPQLKWAVSLPTRRSQAQIVVQYMDFHGGNDIGDGGVLDYYDAVGVHLYGDYDVLSWNYDWPYIFNDMIQNQYCKQILVTEMGINDYGTSDIDKARKYRQFIVDAHPKVHAVAVWTMGRGTNWPQYDLDSPQSWDIIGGISP